jgi:hypothetical protein
MRRSSSCYERHYRAIPRSATPRADGTEAALQRGSSSSTHGHPANDKDQATATNDDGPDPATPTSAPRSVTPL